MYNKIGYVGSEGTLTMFNDAAVQFWGGPWRMPTLKDVEELIKHTSAEWTTVNGVKGTLIKSKINSNSIFLPASGWKNYEKSEYVDQYGDYWCATLDKKDPCFAFYLYNSSAGLGFYTNSRFLGFPIRPVLRDPNVSLH